MNRLFISVETMHFKLVYYYGAWSGGEMILMI